MTTPGFTPSSPPPGAGGTSSTSVLGVPSGYNPPTQLQTSILDFGPGQTAPSGAVGQTQTLYGTTPNAQAYVPGDQYTLPFKDQTAIPQLQQQLVQAGLLNPKDVRIGQWDATSADAYSKVLAFANQYGLNANQALDVFLNNPKLGTAGASTLGGSGTNASLFFPEANPADVSSSFQNVSQSLTGQEQSGQLPAFQAAFTGAENAAAQGKDVAKSQTGGQYEQKPSPTAFAQQYIQSHDPGQELAYGTASRMQDFLSMLGIK